MLILWLGALIDQVLDLALQTNLRFPCRGIPVLRGTDIDAGNVTDHYS